MNVRVGSLYYIRLSFIVITILVLCCLYNDFNLVHFIPVIIVDCLSLFLCRLNSKSRTTVKLTRARAVGMSAFLIVMSLIGYMAGSDGGTTLDGVLCLWFYTTLGTCLLGIVMPAIFSQKKGGVNVATPLVANSAMYCSNGQTVTPYPESDYSVTDYDWPQSDYHTSALSSDSFDINPATGQTMVGMYDTSGCLYGYSDPVFTDHNHTNQFSDFDYHNNP